MEADEIAKRIRQIRDIEIAMDESGEGRTPYSDALRNAIPYMTLEEIRENLFRTLDKLDALCADKTNVESLLRKEREVHEREMANAEARHEAELASRDKAIADRDKAIAEKDLLNTDANHKAKSMNKEKFQGFSKKA